MTPEEASQAAQDLGARHLIPAHIGKFSLAYHPWDEPFKRIVAASKGKAYRLVTPVIGGAVYLADVIPEHTHWWEQFATGVS